LDREGFEVFFSAALRREVGGGRAADSIVATLLWADIDRPPDEARAEIEALERQGLCPKIIVKTGSGLQVHIAIDPVDLTDEEDRREHKAALRALARSLKADASRVDQASVMRVPFTHNRKNKFGSAGYLACYENENADLPTYPWATVRETAPAYPLAKVLEILGVSDGAGDEPDASDGQAQAPDPYWIANHQVTAAGTPAQGPHGGRHRSLLALVGALAGAGVQEKTIRTILHQVNHRNCVPPKSEEEVEAILAFVAGKQKEKKRRTPYPAVRAFLRTQIADVEFSPATGTITGKWLPTGETVDLHVIKSTDLQLDLLRRVGDLGTFAQCAHPKAKAGLILKALRDLVPQGGLGESEEELDEESAPTRLLNALLDAPVWVEEFDVQAQRTVRRHTTLREEPGRYPSAGVALSVEQDGRGVLRVNLANAIIGALRDNPDFGRGRKSVTKLARILKQVRGYRRGRERGGGWRDARWHVIDLDPRTEPAPEAGQTPNGTGGTDGTA